MTAQAPDDLKNETKARPGYFRAGLLVYRCALFYIVMFLQVSTRKSWMSLVSRFW